MMTPFTFFRFSDSLFFFFFFFFFPVPTYSSGIHVVVILILDVLLVYFIGMDTPGACRGEQKIREKEVKDIDS